ncbi:hypothetical protein Pcinc_016259 [Petrolisthes cinctipes]|uniref:alpha-amylase n=1 Tax=Petrolisthes cinctipes TaxID=88211 RepID=A0AAE1FT62_PETCI|nr:hypothetical protein Pcinc_016259 [Petrolisthes cinctipes]
MEGGRVYIDVSGGKQFDIFGRVGVVVGGSLCDYRQTLVHLFEWRWDDIANECEEVLAPAGYCAVQLLWYCGWLVTAVLTTVLSRLGKEGMRVLHGVAPQEHRVAAGRSWTLRYEPVSYELDSHSGTLTSSGIWVIVDAVLNNMVEENTWGYGSAGSPYDARNYTFPPYDDAYFFSSTCTSSNGLVNSYNTTSEARDCRLDGKLDLSTGREPVRLIMVYYLNELIAFGVAGFRMDAASNIWPQWYPTFPPTHHLTNLLPPTISPTFLPTTSPTFYLPHHPSFLPLLQPSLPPPHHPSFPPPHQSSTYLTTVITLPSTTSSTFPPTTSPTFPPTTTPTFPPTTSPTFPPTTTSPTFPPTTSPTFPPTTTPTFPPTTSPTFPPTTSPTFPPTTTPTFPPTTSPTFHPTTLPTFPPSTQDLEDIKSKVTNLSVAAGFEPGTPPFFFYDLVEPGTAILHQDYYPLGAVTERRYGREVAAGMDDFTLLATLYDHLTPSSSAVVFVDSHLSQRDTSLVVGGGVLTYLEQRMYQMATAFMLADDYGVTARVMSSYEFYDPMEGPPVDPSTNDTTLHVTTDSQGQCDSPWVCEHRWPPIVGMVEFRNAAANTTRTSFEILASGCLVLNRGEQGFFAMCPDGVMDEVVNTGLPEGQYCDVVSSSCNTTLDVASDGTARVIINNYDVPFVAYCTGCGPTGAFTTTTDQPAPTTDFNTDFPATDFNTDFPTTDFTSDFPATDFTSDFPATDFTSDFPATDFNTDFPTTDFTSDFPATDFTSDFPATDFTSDFPATDFPTTDFTSDLPTTTDSPYKRTVVFVHKKVYESQYVFVRGGVNEETHPECGPPAETDTCSLPIYHQSLGTTPNYDKYDAWRVGDDFLDWFGAESGQGYYQGIPASGTPMAWTTNRQGVDGYQQLNVYGDDYWMLDFYMDCELPDDEWFELKGWLEFADGYTGWELDISQGTCGGSVGGTDPSVSTNHKGRCGYINVFEWNEGSCIVEDFPGSTTVVPPNTTPGSGGGGLTTTGGMDIQRTVIFLEQHTVVGQDVFILGGSEDYIVCMEGSDAESDHCSLPIVTRSLGNTAHYSGYDDWRTGDNYLDWYGAEVGQGYHNGLPPFGSAVAWTSSDPNSPGYQPLNTFGEAYWMMDFDLDCSLTDDGWFIVKGWLNGDAGQFSGLEDDVTQTTCTGTAGGAAPVPSTSHVARCGHVNVFHYDQADCTINVFP